MSERAPSVGLPRSWAALAGFLRAELAEFPGRANVVLRNLIGSAIVIVASMALQVPLLALSLIVVFYVTQSNVVITRSIGILLFLGSTFAVGSAILLLGLTFDYPLIRIALASAIFFCSVYLMRVVKLGLVFFVVALVVIYVQSFVDLTDNAEALVRSCLWVWVAVNYAVVLALLINTLFLPMEPELQLKAEIHRQLSAVTARLTNLLDGGGAAQEIAAHELQRGAVALQKLLKFTGMRGPDSTANDARGLACVTTVARLYRAASELPAQALRLPASALESLHTLRDSCLELDRSLAAGRPFHRLGEPHRLPFAAAQEMQRALNAFGELGDDARAIDRPPLASPMMAADAWTNPAYARFSLRTLFAVLICYLFYNAVRWPGIHTIMLTCLIVALPNLGASRQHGILRIGGALLGSALALLMVVFVIPHLEGIVGLLLMSLPVIALGAWVSAGSERISYAGVQIMFTFSLALLEQFSPPSDLTEIRDRLVGILLGVGISTLIQMSIWPEGEADALRAKLAEMLRTIASLLRQHLPGTAEGSPLSLAQRQWQAWTMLAECEALLVHVTLEPNWQEGEQERVSLLAQTVLAQGRTILLANQVFQNEWQAGLGDIDAATLDAASSFQASAAERLVHYAGELERNPPAARHPAPLPVAGSGANSVGDPVDGAADLPLMAAARATQDGLLGLPDWGIDAGAAMVRFQPLEHGATL